MSQAQRTLEFHGVIASGVRKYGTLTFPRRDQITDATADWPDFLYPGSLNVAVQSSGFPGGFQSPPAGIGIRRLDDRTFKPQFVIPADKIGGNTLIRPADPQFGSAQVWRATLHVHKTSQRHDCWVVRRIGSGVPANVLEIVSSDALRSALGLQDNDGVTVAMREKD